MQRPARLALFDIDGTLIDARGAGGLSMLAAIDEVYGVAGDLDGYSFHGRTDPLIIRDLATMWGVAPEDVDERLEACLETYGKLVEVEVTRTGVTVLPGVRKLLEDLAADGTVVLGLLTGNIESGARSKLVPVDLAPFFALGAYGSDAERRDELPAVAVARARALTGRSFVGKRIVVIGDTPADISCGAHLGVTSVGVATGRHSVADLTAAGADHVLSDLSDLRRARAAIAP